MENHIAASRDGTVTDVPIEVGQVVESGAMLADHRLARRIWPSDRLRGEGPSP